MSTAANFDLASIPDRIQFEVQRAIQRSIKGVKYFLTSGPTLESTPKDVLISRGTATTRTRARHSAQESQTGRHGSPH
jgi:polyhydroxyalkanoate synthase subunit PhaC